jgi:tetratricopeptide (TPR) repeat protein
MQHQWLEMGPNEWASVGRTDYPASLFGWSDQPDPEILRTGLDRARKEYLLGHVQLADSSLRRLIKFLEPLVAIEEKTEKDLSDSLAMLYGSCLTLQGRILERLHEGTGAAEFFDRAIKLFEKIFKSPKARLVHRSGMGRNASQFYRDYGISLQIAGKKDEAGDWLRKALKSGDKSLDCRYYLGLNLLDHKKKVQAEKLLRLALRQAPLGTYIWTRIADSLAAYVLPEEAAVFYHKAAIAMVSAGEIGKALEMLNRASSCKPKDFEILLEKGEALLTLGRYDEALHVLEKVTKEKPRDARAIAAKGLALASIGRVSEATRVLEVAETLDPTTVSIPVQKGIILLKNRQLGEALQSFKKAQKLSPNYPIAVIYEADALMQLGKHAEALQVLDKAAELAPDNIWAQIVRSRVLQGLGQYAEALACVEKVLISSPNNPVALAEKAETLRQLAQYDESLTIVDQAIALGGQVPTLIELKGRVLLKLKRTKEAAQVLNSAVQLDPNRVWANVDLGEALRELDDYDGALRALKKASKLAPDEGLVCAAWGDILGEIGEFGDSAVALERASKLTPKVAWIWGYKGWALQNLGPSRAEEAYGAYKIAMELAPHNPWWHKGLGNAIRMLSQKAKSILSVTTTAVQEYEWVIQNIKERKKVDSALVALMGWCHYRLGHYHDALGRLSEALSLDSDSTYIHFDLALVLFCTGEYFLGARDYERALSMLEKNHPFRRRGFLTVALNNLRDALNENPALGTKKEVQGALERLEAVFKELPKPPK